MYESSSVYFDSQGRGWNIATVRDRQDVQTSTFSLFYEDEEGERRLWRSCLQLNQVYDAEETLFDYLDAKEA